jgi:hypothetical protein
MDSGSLCRQVGRYDNPAPTCFLTPIDFSKIAAQYLLSIAEVIPEGLGKFLHL